MSTLVLGTNLSTEAAHFGARVLKWRPPGEGGLKFGFFRRLMKWPEVCMGESLTPIFRGIHSPGHTKRSG